MEHKAVRCLEPAGPWSSEGMGQETRANKGGFYQVRQVTAVFLSLMTRGKPGVLGAGCQGMTMCDHVNETDISNNGISNCQQG